MAEGEILAEAAVTPEEEILEEEEVEILLMTNSQDNNPRSSKEINESQKPSCRNGTYTGASIDSLHK